MSEVEAYARLMAFDYEHRFDFMVYVERLDGAYMEHVQRLREAEERKDKRSKEMGGGKRRR